MDVSIEAEDASSSSVGKVNFDPCPEICHTQFTRILLDIPLSPPPRLPACAPQHKMLGKLLGLLKSFAHNERTYQINYNISYTNTMKNFSPTCNIYIRGNNYGFNVYNNSESEKEDADEVNFEEVKPKTTEVHTEVCYKDYSNSPLVPLLTYPEHAQYFISWLHLNMDNQKDYREKLKPFRAVTENGYFKKVVPFEIFVEEFGYELSQGWYSTLMGDNSKYSDDELKLALQTLDKERFKQDNL